TAPKGAMMKRCPSRSMSETTVVRGTPDLRPRTVSSVVALGVMPIPTSRPISALAKWNQPFISNVRAIGISLSCACCEPEPALELSEHLVHSLRVEAGHGGQAEPLQRRHYRRRGILRLDFLCQRAVLLGIPQQLRELAMPGVVRLLEDARQLGITWRPQRQLAHDRP